ncbi:MAG: FtsX-like permease family protein [Bacillota bacterium]|nr:FtsX-like permease family protein [Bacillota bacterium]
MRKVSNRKAIGHLSNSILKADRKKNGIVILAIMLTCILFTALFSVGGTMINSMQESTMRQVGGSAMAGFKFIQPEDYEKLSADSEVKDPSYRILVGTVANPEMSKLYAEVNYAQDENADNMFSYPEKGHMPEERLEVALSTVILDEMGIPHKLGEKIPLDIDIDGEIVNETFTLCGYWEGDPIAPAQQCWVSREYCDEVAPTPDVSYYDEPMRAYAGYWMMDFNYSNSWNIEEKTIAVLERNGYDSQVMGYGVNWAYATSTVDPQTLTLVITLLLIILASGYLIIYNVFYISVSKDLRNYGLLKTIGTTGRQLKRLVRLQAYKLSLIGIPAGLILGTVISRLIVPEIIKNFDMGDLVFSFNPLIYLLAAAFSFVTVFLSCGKPCRLAAKVSPMEAINYTDSNQGAAKSATGRRKQKRQKKQKKARRVSPFSMARANLGRTRRKVVVVVLSLSLSMILLNATYSIISGLDADKYVGRSIIGDFSVTDASVENASSQYLEMAGVTAEDQQALAALDGVQQVSNIYCGNIDLVLDEAGYERVMDIVDVNREKFEKYPGEADHVEETGSLGSQLYGMDRWAMEKLEVFKGSIDWEKFSQGNYVILDAYDSDEDNKDPAADMYYDVGDTVSLELADGSVKEYEVMALANVPRAMDLGRYAMLGAVAVLPTDEFLAHAENDGALRTILNVEPDKMDSVEQSLESYTEGVNDSLTYSSRQVYLDEFRGFTRMFTVVGSALSVILAVIGILNFINVIITGILARKQEFAMLQAVGMTGRQLKDTLIWEGMIYAGATILFAVTFGSLLCSIVVEALAGQIWFFQYHFTVLPILMCIPAVAVLTWLIPTLAYRSMRKETVVERLRVTG